MDFFESDLEDIIFKCLQSQSGCDRLKELGLDVDKKPTLVFRQPRIGDYGIADIVTVDKWYYNNIPNIYVTVYELKRNDVDEKTLIQAHRYAVGIRHYLKIRGYDDVLIKTILIGRNVNNSDWVYMMDEGGLSDVFTYDYTIDGMKFTHETFKYRLVKPNFK